jgi:hypothetical protein
MQLSPAQLIDTYPGTILLSIDPNSQQMCNTHHIQSFVIDWPAG